MNETEYLARHEMREAQAEISRVERMLQRLRELHFRAVEDEKWAFANYWDRRHDIGTSLSDLLVWHQIWQKATATKDSYAAALEVAEYEANRDADTQFATHNTDDKDDPFRET